MMTHNCLPKWFPWDPINACDMSSVSLLAQIRNMVNIGLKLMKLQWEVAFFSNIFTKTNFAIPVQQPQATRHLMPSYFTHEYCLWGLDHLRTFRGIPHSEIQPSSSQNCTYIQVWHQCQGAVPGSQLGFRILPDCSLVPSSACHIIWPFLILGFSELITVLFTYFDTKFIMLN